MYHDWLVVQLDGIRAYAETNGLHRLASKLECARLVALTEIASINAMPPRTNRDPDDSDKTRG